MSTSGATPRRHKAAVTGSAGAPAPGSESSALLGQGSDDGIQVGLTELEAGVGQHP